MKTTEGDLLKLASADEFDVIIHGCNCFCTMWLGIALSIKLQFPEAYKADCATAKGAKVKLGSYSHAEVSVGEHTCTMVNAYTQFNWRGNKS